MRVNVCERCLKIESTCRVHVCMPSGFGLDGWLSLINSWGVSIWGSWDWSMIVMETLDLGIAYIR